MGAKTRWRTSFLLSLLSTAIVGQEPPRLKLSIVVYDGAHVGSKTTDRAERLAGTILLTASIQSSWVAGPVEDLGSLGMDFTAYAAKDCQADSISAVLRVQILPRAPVGLPPHALALSLPCARSGVQVTIFADRVAHVTETGGPTFGRVLAYAIAHELGHVLLRSDAHGSAGLMKGTWSKSDWQRAAVIVVSFSPAEARQVAALHKRTPDENAIQLVSLKAR
jgi:hypothetical protein